MVLKDKCIQTEKMCVYLELRLWREVDGWLIKGM